MHTSIHTLIAYIRHEHACQPNQTLRIVMDLQHISEILLKLTKVENYVKKT